MIDKRQIPEILKGYDEVYTAYWFDKKCKKFLHSIDTFYYSIKLKQDFTRHSDDAAVLSFRRFFSSEDSMDIVNLTGTEYLRQPGVFARFYDIHLQNPEYYDVFISSTVPEASGSDKASVTSEVIVQLRSYYLWQKGVHAAFDESYSQVKALLEHFNLEVDFVIENRADYCWHTNYLSNPEQFLQPNGNLDKMLQTRLSNTHPYQAQFARDIEDTSKVTYLAFGMRGQKFFVRIYDKVREVLEMGYKPWFFQLWLFHGLINRFDLYCFEEVFKTAARLSRYRKLDIARLKWFLEFKPVAADEEDYKLIQQIVVGGYTDRDVIRELADKYTPAITRIFNFEFQCMRKASKSFVLFPGAGGTYSEAEQIYDYLDNHDLIIRYLTSKVLCFKDPDDSRRKKDRDYCAFWKALRSTKLVDCKQHPEQLKLIRQYNSKMNMPALKRRIINSLSMYSIYNDGVKDNDSYLYQDAALFLSTLNDNDIYQAYHYKQHRRRSFNSDELQGFRGFHDPPKHDLVLVDWDSGQIVNDVTIHKEHKKKLNIPQRSKFKPYDRRKNE